MGYRRTYHVVWCPTYRRPVTIGGLYTGLKQTNCEVHAERDTTPDHVCPLVTRDPQCGIHRLVGQVKGCLSCLPRVEFPSLRSRLPTLEPQLPRRHRRRRALEVVTRHVENQRNA